MSASTRGRVHARPLCTAVALLVALVGLLGSPAAAQTGFAATASPPDELVNGQYVRVEWSGFPANSFVSLRQCPAQPASVADCAPLKGGTTRSNGTGTEFFQVSVGALDRDGNPNTTDDRFTCGFDTPCSIAVTIDSAELDQGATIPIAFAFPPSSCPASSGSLLSGAGASGVLRAMNRWLGIVCREPLRLGVDFSLLSSPSATEQFATGGVDYAITSGLGLSEAERQQVESDGDRVGYAPVAASGLVLAFNVRDRTTAERITDLILTPQQIAQVFTGQLKNLNDAAVTANNPGIAFPGQLKAVGRADASAQTLTLTSWLDAVAREAYQAGGPGYRNGPGQIFPSTGDIALYSSPDKVVQEVAAPSQNNDFTTFGFIGWMDSSAADLAGLPSVTIRMPGGDTRADAAGIAGGLAAMKQGEAEGLLVPDYTVGGPGVYPLPLVHSMVTRVEGLSPELADIQQRFLRYLAGDGQAVLQAGYVPLPAALAERSRGVADAIGGGNGTPAATPSPTPASGQRSETATPGSGSGGGAPPAAAAPQRTPPPASVPSGATTPFGGSLVNPSAAPAAAVPTTPTRDSIAVEASDDALVQQPVSTLNSVDVPQSSTAAAVAASGAPLSVVAAPDRLDSGLARFVLPGTIGLGVLCALGGAGMLAQEGRRRRRETTGEALA